MIESLQTPINMKLQLIPVLRHMHHDANTAAMVKTLCVNLLPKYPSENFVIVILDSLSELSCATLIDIPDQVNLLLTYMEDPRRKVRCQVLVSLKTLAEMGAHLWSRAALNSLLKAAMMCADMGDEQTLILSVILKLTRCPVTCHSLIENEQHLVMQLCSSCLVLEHHSAASLALEILTSLVCYCHTEDRVPAPQLMNLIDLHLESLLYATWMSEVHLKEYASYLKCGVKLAENNIAFGGNFLEIIGSMLAEESLYSPKHTRLVGEALAALSAQFCIAQFKSEHGTGDNPMHDYIWRILNKMKYIAHKNAEPDNIKIIEVLSAVVFQSLIGYHLPENVFRAFEEVLGKINCWAQYRVARSASRYGHHVVAAVIYKKLSHSVSMDKLHFFLTSLFQIAQAECILLTGFTFEDIQEDYSIIDQKHSAKNKKKRLPLVEKLDTSISLYWKALATLKASSSPTQAMNFQSEFVRLRGQFLEALFNVVITKNTQTMTPPPAIAQTLAQNSRDHLQKFGHVTNQLRKSVKTFKVCEELYAKLYKCSFDADPGTLDYLDISKFMCAVMGHSLEAICFTTPSDFPNITTERNAPETTFFLRCLKRVEEQLKNLPNEAAAKKSITNNHTNVLLAQIELIVNSPLAIPRFFFQVLQNTSIKLSVSPQPRTPGEPVVVSPNSNLVVKVEGVIQHHVTNPGGPFRRIESVQLNLIAQVLSTKPNEPTMKPPNDTVQMTQSVKPHHDFLSGSFLLSLNNVPSTGQWQEVTVEASVIDQNGVLWATGPKSVLQIRVPATVNSRDRPN